jgi:hypothetical protein
MLIPAALLAWALRALQSGDDRALS